MYNKASKTPQDALISANSYIGSNPGIIEAPGLLGWESASSLEPTKEICLADSATNAGSLYLYELGFGLLWPPTGTDDEHEWIATEFENLKQYDTIYLCFTNDAVGQKCAAEASRRLGAYRCPLVKLPFQDAQECLQQEVSKETIQQCFREAKPIDPAELRRASEYANLIKQGINHVTDAQMGYALPWDKAFGTINFRPGELTVWTGINGHGKSQLLGHLMLDQIKQGANVCIASMELAPVKTLIRMTRQASAVKTPPDEFIDRVCRWWGKKLWLFDLVGTAKAERLIEVFKYGCQRYGIDVFVIDSLMKCGFADDDYSGQKRFLDQLSDFKNEFNCHVHVVAHPRKAHDENTAPSKLDVKGVSGITDLADNCMSVWRNKPKEDLINFSKNSGTEPSPEIVAKADCHLRCSKQRFGDWEGVITLWFDKESLQYMERQADRPRQFVK
jgi:twinkle protein